MKKNLLEYLLSNGISEDEANSIIISYFEGRKKIEESGITLSDQSNPDIPDSVWSDDYDSTFKNYDWTEFTISAVSSTKGTFEGGANYSYNSDTKGLIIDGIGSFTANDYSNLAAAFDIDFLVIGKDVVIPESMSGTLINEWLMGITEKHSSYPVYTYADSDVNEKYVQMMNFMTSNLDCNEDIFKEDFIDNLSLIIANEIIVNATSCINFNVNNKLYNNEIVPSSTQKKLANIISDETDDLLNIFDLVALKRKVSIGG